MDLSVNLAAKVFSRLKIIGTDPSRAPPPKPEEDPDPLVETTERDWREVGDKLPAGQTSFSDIRICRSHHLEARVNNGWGPCALRLSDLPLRLFVFRDERVDLPEACRKVGAAKTSAMSSRPSSPMTKPN